MLTFNNVSAYCSFKVLDLNRKKVWVFTHYSLCLASKNFDFRNQALDNWEQNDVGNVLLFLNGHTLVFHMKKNAEKLIFMNVAMPKLSNDEVSKLFLENDQAQVIFD